MSRRAQAPVRTILPDPKFNNAMLAKFMNVVMKSGKKSAAERIIYGALDRISEKTGKKGAEAIDVLSTALDNVKPVVEVKSRRVGGATYQVPVEVRSTRRQTLAMRWVIEAARDRSEKSMAFRLAHELMDAAENRGCRRPQARRHAPHGRGQQGLRPLPLVSEEDTLNRGTRDAHRALSEHRHLRAHRRGEDDDDRAHPVLHRRLAQDR